MYCFNNLSHCSSIMPLRLWMSAILYSVIVHNQPPKTYCMSLINNELFFCMLLEVKYSLTWQYSAPCCWTIKVLWLKMKPKQHWLIHILSLFVFFMCLSISLVDLIMALFVCINYHPDFVRRLTEWVFENAAGTVCPMLHIEEFIKLPLYYEILVCSVVPSKDREICSKWLWKYDYLWR